MENNSEKITKKERIALFFEKGKQTIPAIDHLKIYFGEHTAAKAVKAYIDNAVVILRRNDDWLKEKQERKKAAN
jgi:hypothetical protein